MHFMFKFTEYRQNIKNKTVEFRTIPLEDTIRPVELKFNPPLQDFGTNPSAFQYHWERLTFYFNLPNPADFPKLPLSGQDKDIVDRYIATCRNLAGYTEINDASGGMNVKSEKGSWTLTANLPTHQEFTGISATFRQIHSDKENASFIAARRAIEQSIRILEDEESQQKTRAVIKEWSRARQALSKKMLETLICEELMATAPPETPRSLQGIEPDKIITTYNYGETLHWGNYREALKGLEDDPNNEKFHKICCIHSIAQLSHLYFGFAELCASACGYAQVT